MMGSDRRERAAPVASTPERGVPKNIIVVTTRVNQSASVQRGLTKTRRVVDVPPVSGISYPFGLVQVVDKPWAGLTQLTYDQ